MESNKAYLVQNLAGKFNSTALEANFASFSNCPEGLFNQILNAYCEGKWVIAPIFIILALALALFSPKLKKMKLYIATFFTIQLFSGIMASVALKWENYKDDSTAELVVGFSVLIGILISGVFAMPRFQRVGSFFLGALTGFTLGLMANNTVLYFSHNDHVFWVCSLISALFFGIINDVRNENRLMHLSSLAGSYFIIYGIGMLAGRFTNPFLIIQLINKGIIREVDEMFYLYLACYFILYLIGFSV